MVTECGYLFFWGGVFSNFHPCKIEYAGHIFKSSEQLFMYFKALEFEDTETLDLIIKASTPAKAKKLGRLVKNFNSTKWDEVKEMYMCQALEAKALYCKEFAEALFEIYKNYNLVEASPVDRIWGIGFGEYEAIANINKWGENLLGKCLMKVRDFHNK